MVHMQAVGMAFDDEVGTARAGRLAALRRARRARRAVADATGVDGAAGGAGSAQTSTGPVAASVARIVAAAPAVSGDVLVRLRALLVP